MTIAYSLRYNYYIKRGTMEENVMTTLSSYENVKESFTVKTFLALEINSFFVNKMQEKVC